MTLALVNSTHWVFILWEFLTCQLWWVHEKHSNIQINLIIKSIVSVLVETTAGITDCVFWHAYAYSHRYLRGTFGLRTQILLNTQHKATKVKNAQSSQVFTVSVSSALLELYIIHTQSFMWNYTHTLAWHPYHVIMPGVMPKASRVTYQKSHKEKQGEGRARESLFITRTIKPLHRITQSLSLTHRRVIVHLHTLARPTLMSLSRFHV